MIYRFYYITLFYTASLFNSVLLCIFMALLHWDFTNMIRNFLSKDALIKLDPTFAYLYKCVQLQNNQCFVIFCMRLLHFSLGEYFDDEPHDLEYISPKIGFSAVNTNKKFRYIYGIV